jgi:hypothetical protein
MKAKLKGSVIKRLKGSVIMKLKGSVIMKAKLKDSVLKRLILKC